MTKRLSESDRRAVDLLLDRTAGGMSIGGPGSTGFVAHAQPGDDPGVGGVQRVLNLLDRMPAAEPRADLIASTMARIDAGGVMGAVHSTVAAMMTDRPNA